MSTAIVHVPIPGGSVVSAVRGTLDWSVRTATFLVAAPNRLAALLSTVEQLVGGVQQILLATTEIMEAAARVTARVDVIASRADVIVERTNSVVDSAAALIAEIEPIAQKLLPHAETVADSLSDEEVRALMGMLDRLPDLERSAEALLPILATMETVAPELHELLLVTEDLRRAVVGIPGFKFLRGRGQAKLDGGDV
ncbi:ribulose-1,5-bisphosphate carboxylase/oxygenase large subunit [Millisia brevis]|uniref:ribulose-1,5-bisphosphate carboxylase/oxygenase large subunit n=1 Tax=Millisia brevis TaxID=264148 RepID=UPI0012EE183C|nr:ribulose-1,5-bisphosphate carboxylase/oxygenase large subunit [Millisia brevis]